ncbi:MAG: metallophosphoesterase [Methanobacteriota archaeon]|nr:MAG: metallophosphoesterase [Euryarchaeota archaeon]
MTVATPISDGLEICAGGAAMLTDTNTMVVADLHLGCEAALEYKGLSIPRVQTRKISAYLEEAVSSYSPEELVVAGDLKHNFSRNLVQVWKDVAEFVKTVVGRVSLSVVRGNHDNYLGAILAEHGLRMTDELRRGRFVIGHGHRAMCRRERVLMGHIHPSITLREATGARLKSGCFLYRRDREVLVLPALSLVSPGVDVIGSTCADRMSPMLSDSGLADFEPLVVSKEGVLRFPKVRALRESVSGGVDSE